MAFPLFLSFFNFNRWSTVYILMLHKIQLSARNCDSSNFVVNPPIDFALIQSNLRKEFLYRLQIACNCNNSLKQKLVVLPGTLPSSCEIATSQKGQFQSHCNYNSLSELTYLRNMIPVNLIWQTINLLT